MLACCLWPVASPAQYGQFKTVLFLILILIIEIQGLDANVILDVINGDDKGNGIGEWLVFNLVRISMCFLRSTHEANDADAD